MKPVIDIFQSHLRDKMSSPTTPDGPEVIVIGLPVHVETSEQHLDRHVPSITTRNVVYIQDAHYETRESDCKCGKCICASLFCILCCVMIVFVLGFFPKI